jgi:hypothetical protein
MNEYLNNFLLFTTIAIFACMILGYPLMFLWNTCLVGAVETINPIGFWQAIGINFLSMMLFKNWTSTTKIK